MEKSKYVYYIVDSLGNQSCEVLTVDEAQRLSQSGCHLFASEEEMLYFLNE